jgi:hypothetical protein
MDSRDRHRQHSDDVACSVCREPVPPRRTQVLARREDLVFVELDCPACASVTLGFVLAPDERLLPEPLRLAGSPPVSTDDVLDMHRHLADWSGDLHSLLSPGSGPGGR